MAGAGDRGTRVTSLAADLREAILSGRLAEGTALRQDALARAHGVSRLPVREALRLLVAEGLVVMEANRGARVAGLSAAEITELFDIRAVLEPHLLTLALPRMDVRALDAAESVLDAYEEALDRGEAARWGDLNWAFHQALLTAADRPRTLDMITSLRRQVDRYTRLQITVTEGGAQARREHREILALARAGETTACAAALAAHIRGAAAALTEALARRPSA